MTTLYLIRHGLIDPLGHSIAGRAPGVLLNAMGRGQVERLADYLSRAPIRRIYSSPMDRTRETADALARRLNLSVELSDDLAEIDYGDWTGRRLDELHDDPVWRSWNSQRGSTRVPNGELMLEVQTRLVRFLLDLRRRPDEAVAVVSHGDPIKAAIAYFLGVPLDLFHRIEISPASLSVLRFDADGPHLLCLNHHGPDAPLSLW